MSAVSEMMVREFFELRGFLVRQARKHVAPVRGEEEEADFFLFNPQPRPSVEPLPFVLEAGNVDHVERAIVSVRGWHTETFRASRLARTPEIFRFVDPESLRRAARAFGGDSSIRKILVVPALPSNPAARAESLDLLKSKGIDGVIAFRAILAELVNAALPNRNYQKSDVLQMIRLLKNYDFIKDPQLELFKAARPRKVRPAPAGSN